jgi:hypothetical protein
MGRPPGSQNKLTAERDRSAQKLAADYGDPLEDLFQKRAHWQTIYDTEMAKPSRRRNPKKIEKAEEMILRYNIEALPYVRPKYQAITTKDETPRLTVIRAPEVISDTKAWLEKYKPKQIAAEPVSNPAVDGRDENPCDS